MLTEEGGVASLVIFTVAEFKLLPAILLCIATRLIVPSGIEVRLKLPVKVKLVQLRGIPRVVDPALITTFAVPLSEQVPEIVMAD